MVRALQGGDPRVRRAVTTEYKDKGFVVVGVSIDDPPAQLRAFTKQWQMQYPIAQMQSDIEDAYGPLLRRPHVVLHRARRLNLHEALGPATRAEFEQEIKALL